MLLQAQLGQTPSLAAHEIKSVAARDVAPPLAVIILSQGEVFLHTDKIATTWGQVPSERLASIAALGLSNFMQQLGGTLRLIDIISDGERPKSFTNRPSELADTIWNRANLASGDGKLLVGLSAIGLAPSILTKLMGELKNRARSVGRSIRLVVPPRGHSELTAASLRQNKILEKGFEFILINRQGGVSVGLTLTLHDPNRDARLDRGIPAADARSGMLPPKLARMILNCAVGDETAVTVLDPFCGNGRILLEGALQQYRVVGRDIDDAKVRAARQNLDWLAQQYGVPVDYDVQRHDATQPVDFTEQHVIATETWLGPPLRFKPYADKARGYADEVGQMLRPALKSLLASRPRRIVIAVPAWRLESGGCQEVPGVLDVFQENGYVGECIARYARSDSFVERVILEANPK